jgi:hypothetical protein
MRLLLKHLYNQEELLLQRGVSEDKRLKFFKYTHYNTYPLFRKPELAKQRNISLRGVSA